MIDQLIANIKKTNAPIVVGLDPMMKFIPEQIQRAAFAEYGISACHRRTSAWSGGVLGRQRACKQHGWKP